MLRTAARRAAERRALVLRTALPERGAFVVRAVLRLVVIFAICFRRVEPASEGNKMEQECTIVSYYPAVHFQAHPATFFEQTEITPLRLK